MFLQKDLTVAQILVLACVDALTRTIMVNKKSLDLVMCSTLMLKRAPRSPEERIEGVKLGTKIHSIRTVSGSRQQPTTSGITSISMKRALKERQILMLTVTTS
jgi:hypothetical protein